MKRIFLLAALLLASQTLLSADEDKAKESNWHTEAALGASVPLKLIYTGSQKSKGFSAQLEGLYRARTDKGLALFAGAAAGPFFSKGFKAHDSRGLCVNVNFWGGAGYDFLKKNERQALILSGLLGIDIFTFTNYEYKDGRYCRNENTAYCFEIGAELSYTIQITDKLCFYSGCSILAGIGWTNSTVTKEKTFFEREETKSKEYDSCKAISLQPKIGLMYKID